MVALTASLLYAKRLDSQSGKSFLELRIITLMIYTKLLIRRLCKYLILKSDRKAIDLNRFVKENAKMLKNKNSTVRFLSQRDLNCRSKRISFEGRKPSNEMHPALQLFRNALFWKMSAKEPQNQLLLDLGFSLLQRYRH